VSVLALAAHYVVGFLVVAEVLWLLLKLRRGSAPIAVLAAIVAVGLGVLVLQEHRTSGGALSDGAWTQSYSLASRLLQVPAQLLVGYQPPLQLVSAGVAALLAAAALALLVARGDARERSAARPATFVCVVGVGVPMLLAATGELSGLTTRYLVGAWIPLAAIAAAGLTARAAGSAGPMVTACICGLFLAIDMGSAWEPKFDRDDWRGAAEALISPRAKRAIVVSPGVGAPAFELYRPSARELPARGERLREIALVGLPRPYRKIGERPRPPRPVSRPPWPGFARVSERRGGVYTIVLFRSVRPREVRPGPLARRGLGESNAAVLLERPPGR
jgi:hypothetical protein